MNIFTEIKTQQIWNISKETEPILETPVVTGTQATLTSGDLFVKKTVTEVSKDVFSRIDTVTNNGSTPLTLTVCRARFTLDGGTYEVYSQHNCWQKENRGRWSELVTNVEARCESVRTSDGANPFMGLWNVQTGRGLALHLIPQGSWSMSVSRAVTPDGGPIVIEIGMAAHNFCLTLAPGETFTLPEILFYEIRDKLSMDSHKLHRYCVEHFPQKELPVVFNTWLFQFDRISVDNVMEQIPVAADVGAEYFMIDAGWFGNQSRWAHSIGDWVEATEHGFCGRMIDVAEAVRAHGMKFGIWLEPERAVEGSDIIKKYPQYFIYSGEYYFLDFANPEAVQYMLDTIDELIKKYGIEYFKFDFNADLTFDRTRSAFTKYFNGFNGFMKTLRKTYPHIYFENCAAGGMSMNLGLLGHFDSAWPTDNQSPTGSIRIFKDGIRRLPPQLFERWLVISDTHKIASYFADNPRRVIATGDATWSHTEGISDSYLRAFLTGAPLGLTCNLAALSEETLALLKEAVSEFKKNREYWRTAFCRVLSDAANVLVLQYEDPKTERIIIQIFTGQLDQEYVYVYPILNENRSYRTLEGTVLRGSDIMRQGLHPAIGDIIYSYMAYTFELTAE